MRVLLIGKFPPIEGGVSAQTFWLARALARQGHSVDVVTNAAEVEPTLCQFHDGADAAWLEVTEPGLVRVHRTTPVAQDSYIPFARPFVTTLFGLSLSVVGKYGCDVIFSWYFEPYGITAAMVAQSTGLPFFVRHAGSDLGRLSTNPDLATAYRWMLSKATGLLVTNEFELEKQLGSVKTPRVRLARPALPEVFDSRPDPLDIGELLRAAGSWFERAGLPDPMIRQLHEINEKSFPANSFTVGVYGKVGATKGSFDLVGALTRLAQTGTEFSFVSMSCGQLGTRARYYETILVNSTLKNRTWILPPIAPWRVPAFLARCDAIAFLERRFSIKFHGPLIPLEVLSSGTCLICSNEIAAKPFYQGNLINDRNVVVVADPTRSRRTCEHLA